jgi:hypothetical protein
LYHSALDDRSFLLFAESEQKAWDSSYFKTLEEDREANQLLRKEAANNVTEFMATNTRKYVTLTFNSCGGLANMVSCP